MDTGHSESSGNLTLKVNGCKISFMLEGIVK